MKDKNGKTYYTYPGPAKGSKDHVSKEDMKSIDISKISVDEFIDVVANIHTHGRVWEIMRTTFFLESKQHLNRIKNGKVKNGGGMCISVMI